MKTNFKTGVEPEISLDITVDPMLETNNLTSFDYSYEIRVDDYESVTVDDLINEIDIDDFIEQDQYVPKPREFEFEVFDQLRYTQQGLLGPNFVVAQAPRMEFYNHDGSVMTLDDVYFYYRDLIHHCTTYGCNDLDQLYDYQSRMIAGMYYEDWVWVYYNNLLAQQRRLLRREFADQCRHLQCVKSLCPEHQEII